MAEPLTGLDVGKYAPTALGLLFGIVGKYGLALIDGSRFTWRAILGDIMLLGILGAIAVTIGNWLQLSGDLRVLTGALAAVSSDRLVRLAREYFLRRADDELARLNGGISISTKGAPE